MKLIVRCPAKINTFLSVGPRDETGYHPVRTVLQATSLCDTMLVSTDAASTNVTFRGAAIEGESSVEKAIRLASELAPIPPLHVVLRKRIPIGSGLGGGSSDAAGILRAIQLILARPIADEALFDIAAAIGVDTPFFLRGGRAIGEGYGEHLSPLSDEEPRWLVVAYPLGVPVRTPKAYAALDRLQYAWQLLPADLDATHNDFERVAPTESLALIERLRSLGAARAGLSGSGSAVFGFFGTRGEAHVARRELGTGWIARTLSRGESLKVRAEPY